MREDKDPRSNPSSDRGLSRMPSPSRAASGRSRVAAGHRESDGAAALEGPLGGWPFHLSNRQNPLPLKPLGPNGANMAPFHKAWR
jgi:hypothetical protein